MAQATLTVWKFNSPRGAERASATLQRLAKEQVVTIHDAATVSWEEGGKKPKTQQLTSTAAAGALGGSFWGLLFGLIFFVPLFGAVIGAAMGAMTGALTDVGIDDKMIKSLGKQIVPGSSALFIYVIQATGDKVTERMSRYQPEVLRTSMSHDAEEKLRQALTPS